MTVVDGVFVLFSAFILIGVIGILLTKNVIHAVLFLVAILLSLAGIYVLLNAQFVAIVQILVYAGGVVILLAFGIMITNRPREGRLLTTHDWLFSGIVVSGLMLYLLLKIQHTFDIKTVFSQSEDQVSQIGVGFMTEYILAFELIAFLLLVVLVGASFLAKKYNEE